MNEIVFIEPSADAPLLQCLADGALASDDPIHDWVEDDIQPVQLVQIWRIK